MDFEYRWISGDSHLETSPERWTHRIDAKFRDRGPRRLRMSNGSDALVIEGAPPTEFPFDLYGGKGREQWQPVGQTYDNTPGTGPAAQRVSEMDADGIGAEILFPGQVTGPKFWRNIKDNDAYQAVVRGWNDWLAEEYCSVDPRRLIGVGVIPATNLDSAIAEMAHCKKLGFRTVVISSFPSGFAHPSPEDDRFWAASLDMEMPVCIHVDIDRSLLPGPVYRWPKEDREILKHTDLVLQVSRFGRAAGINAVQLVLSGLFDRFPDLKIDLAENQLGWAPFFMEQGDTRYKRHWKWTAEMLGWTPLKRGLPSEYIREHFYWGFQDDKVGVEMRNHFNIDRLIWATDFPHQESEWPNSESIVENIFEGVPEDEKRKMTIENAVRFFQLADIFALQPA